MAFRVIVHVDYAPAAAPPERHDAPTGGLVHVEPGTPLQTVNHGDEARVLYAYGTPPEHKHAEILNSAL